MSEILVIEDDEITAKLCKLLLSEEHKIVEARSRVEGLRLVRESRPDLVIADLMVPWEEGRTGKEEEALEIVSEIRAIDRGVKVLVYSVLCYEPLYRRRAINLGADDCLIKNGATETFKTTVANLLGLNSKA